MLLGIIIYLFLTNSVVRSYVYKYIAHEINNLLREALLCSFSAYPFAWEKQLLFILKLENCFNDTLVIFLLTNQVSLASTAKLQVS